VNPAHTVVRVRPASDEKRAIAHAWVRLLESGEKTRREAAAAMHAAGMIQREVGEVLGVTYQAIQQMIKQPAVTRKRAQMAEQWERIDGMLTQGLRPSEIASRIGIKLSTLRGRLRRMGSRREVQDTSGPEPDRERNQTGKGIRPGKESVILPSGRQGTARRIGDRMRGNAQAPSLGPLYGEN
jgi:transposase